MILDDIRLAYVGFVSPWKRKDGVLNEKLFALSASLLLSR